MRVERPYSYCLGRHLLDYLLDYFTTYQVSEPTSDVPPGIAPHLTPDAELFATIANRADVCRGFL
jgi:hypothetical protein